MRLSHLPMTITVNGKTLRLVTGENNRLIIQQAKASKKKYRHVTVFNKRLTGKTDGHGRPYPESIWLFVEDYKPS
jgi:hypothetical protein